MQAWVYADSDLQARHFSPGHPERPERIRACLEALEASRVEAPLLERLRPLDVTGDVTGSR